MALEKATLTNKEIPSETVKCMFNPTDYTIAKTNPWQPKPVKGKNVPKLDFAGGGAQTLKMKLLFDKEGEDVSTDINKLFKMTLIHEKPTNDKTKKSRPPLCIFAWGHKWSFTAVIMTLSVQYTLFREDGTPVRAMADITLQEAEDDTVQKKQNPTSFSPGGRKRREVRPHDTLALIAYEEYGDPTHWRAIADENRIDDPLSLRPGQILAIPPRYSVR